MQIELKTLIYTYNTYYWSQSVYGEIIHEQANNLFQTSERPEDKVCSEKSFAISPLIVKLRVAAAGRGLAADFFGSCSDLVG